MIQKPASNPQNQGLKRSYTGSETSSEPGALRAAQVYPVVVGPSVAGCLTSFSPAVAIC
jgi:hypothetical protein